MTVHDPRDPNTFLGVSPTLGYLGQGASNAVPTRTTYTGANPRADGPGARAVGRPVTPQPSPIDDVPAGGTFDPGNTNLSADELSRLFLGFMAPGRTARGRSPVSVIV